MNHSIRVLHLDDNSHDAELVAERLRSEGCSHDIVFTGNKAEFEAAVSGQTFDVIICDFNMPGYDGMSAIHYVREHRPDTPVIVLSGTLGDEAAVGCLKAGATDFVLKHNLSRLVSVVSRAVEENRERQQRRDSERRFSDLFEFAPDALILVNSEGLIIQANCRVKAILGWNPVELEGLHVGMLIPRINQVLRPGLPFLLAGTSALHEAMRGPPEDLVATRKDGTIFPIDISISPMHTANGPVMVAALRDVSERVHVQRRRETEHEVTRALATSDDMALVIPRILESVCLNLAWDVAALWTIDRQTHALKCVSAWQRSDLQVAQFLETTQKMVVAFGKCLPGRIWEKDEPEWVPDVSKDINFSRASAAVAGNLHAAFAFPISSRGTVVGVVEFFSHEIREPDDDLHAMCSSIGRQIGQYLERMNTQAELQMMSNRLALAAKAARVGIWDWDLAGDLLVWDDTMHGLYAVSRDKFEATFEAWRERLHPEDRDHLSAEVRAALKGEREFAGEFRVLLPDNSIRHIQANGTVVRNSAGEPVRMLGTNWDITALKAAEALSMAKKSADAANQAKSAFLATMSHELRTPLSGILGMNDLLAQTELSDKQRVFVEACSSNGRLLLQLINDFLDLSKIEAGKLDLSIRECNVEALVYDVADMMLHSARQKGIALNCSVAPGACVTALCDDNRLRQILVNLAGNAIKFTSSGSVSIECACASRSDGVAKLRFSIADTGMGIPTERRDCLFKAFSQVDGSTSRQFGGTGLGLSICKQLVELMAGSIGVESQVGMGSTFWFEIPLRLIYSEQERALNSQSLAGIRILIAEGREHERRHIDDCLRSWGCQFQHVSSFSETIDAGKRAAESGNPYKVALVDCSLAGGIEYDKLRKIAAIPDLHVIGLGIPADELSGGLLRSLGMRHIVRDLTRPSELFNALSAVVSVHNWNGLADQTSRKTRRGSPTLFSAHLLVAEDNRINQMYVSELLKSFGCTCEIAVNGDQAIQAIQRGNFDLVLMDCQMPELDGFAATREIRRRQAVEDNGKRIRIVALTANALSGDRERCLEAGMDDYLSKPIERAQLQIILQKYLLLRKC